VTVNICPAIVSVPVRDGPVVGATFTPTLPVPVPAGDVRVSQSSLLDAVHGHPVLVVTVTCCEPPAGDTANVEGEIVYTQPSDCVMLKWKPAIVRVPARGGPVVDATENPTGSDPFPLALDVMETQSTSDAAVQVQSGLEARTSTLPVPPAFENEVALLDNSSLHSPAACDTCARWPLTMTPPVRVAGSAFAATMN
jgi:hypothetical protein